MAARAAAIEDGAGRPAAVLVADVRTTAGAFADAAGAMPPAAWHHLVAISLRPAPMTSTITKLAGDNRRDDSVSATTVVNLKGHRGDPDFADVVYVGRAMHRGGWQLPASPLASPFRPGADGSREDVVAKYREYLLGREDLLALLPELRGRRLGCWCAPEACHAMVIAELADAGP